MSSKVIIIDSGIDLKNKVIQQRTLNGVAFIRKDDNKIYQVEDFQDYIGHGTSVASVILSVCNDCYFYPIRIVSEKGESSSRLLIEALDYCKSIDIRTICISMATINQEYYEAIEEKCSELKKQGKIIVSSLDNNHSESAPAIFQDVIGIKGADFKGCQKYYNYQSHEKIQGIFDKTLQLSLTLNGSYRFFKGTSKANALASGNILNILKDKSDLSFKDLNLKLEECAAEFEPILEVKRNDYDGNIDEESILKIKNAIEEVTKKEVKKENIKRYPLMTNYVGLNYGTFYDFLENIAKYFHVSFDYKNVKGEDVCTAKRLLTYINKKRLVTDK
jgi:hypothetical protein